MSNGKGMIIVLTVGLIKKTSYVFRNTSCKQHIKMSQYFPKPFNSHFGDRVKVKIDLRIMQQKVMLKIFHTLILQVLR